MGTYTYAQLEGFWDQAGGDPNVAPIMAAVAEAESSGSDVIQQGQPYATTGWGLWQITPGDSVPSVGIDQALLNPLTNAEAAVSKYKSQGLGAWTTYTSGAYRQYLQGNVSPNTATAANYVTSATSTTATQAGLPSTIASTVLGGLMSGFGITDVKDFAERAGLILFGGLVCVIAILRMTQLDNKAVELGKQATIARAGAGA